MSHKLSEHLMQKHMHTTFLLIIKMKNEHEVQRQNIFQGSDSPSAVFLT